MINRHTVIILVIAVLGLTLTIQRTRDKGEPAMPSAAWAQPSPQQAPAAPSDTPQSPATTPTPEIRNLMQSNGQLEAYIDHLLATIAALEGDKRQGRDELTEARQREQQTRQSLTAAQRQLQETQTRRAQMQERQHATAEQLTTVEAQLQKCTQQFQDAQAEAEQRYQQTLEAHRQEAQTLQADLSTAQQAQQTTQQTLDQARQQLQNCAEEAKEALAAQAQRHHDAMTAQQQKVEALQAAQREAQQRVATTQQALEAAQAQQAQVETRYRETAAALDTARQQLQSRTAALEGLQTREQAARDTQTRMTEQLHGVHEQLGQHLTQEIQERDVTLQQNGDHVLIRLGGKTLFMQGQVVVRRAGQSALQKISDVLKALPDYDVLIAGHADNLPLKGALRERWSTNWTLSSARASAVADCLERHGVAPERLTAMGYSFYRPINHEDSPVGRMQNRRIEIVVTPVNRLNGKAS